MGLYDYVEFSTDFPLPDCEDPSEHTFQTHDWKDSLKTIHVDAHGRLWVEAEALRRHASDETTKHPDPRLSGFNAAVETTPMWSRLDYEGVMEVVGDERRYELDVVDGVVRDVQ